MTSTPWLAARPTNSRMSATGVLMSKWMRVMRAPSFRASSMCSMPRVVTMPKENGPGPDGAGAGAGAVERAGRPTLRRMSRWISAGVRARL